MTTALVQLVFAPRNDSHDHPVAGGRERVRPVHGRDDSTGAHRYSDHDAERIRDIQAGNIAAFESLFAEHWESLWRFARSLTQSSDAAEDLVQGVFSRIWVLRASWTPQGSIQSYLFRAVRNAFLDWRKHRRVIQAYTDTEMRESAEEATAELQAERNDQQARLDVALAELPDGRREGVLLRYEHGLSYADIGAVLGVTAGAAEKQIARTIETLRQRVRA